MDSGLPSPFAVGAGVGGAAVISAHPDWIALRKLEEITISSPLRLTSAESGDSAEQNRAFVSRGEIGTGTFKGVGL